MNGEENDLIRYDDETHLDSLLAQGDVGRSQPYASEPFSTADVGEMGADRESGVPVGPGAGATSEQRAG